MSFQVKKLIFKVIHRKENGSISVHPTISLSQTHRERTSTFATQGSITLEASLVTVFFFFAALCLISLFEIMALQTTIKNALHAVGKEVAMEAYVNPVIPVSKMERQMRELIGRDRLEESFIVGGSNGLDCSHSKKYWNTTIMDLCVNYQVEIPIFVFRLPVISKEEKIRIKGWTGYETKLTSDTDNVMVYVTEYGIVYHKDMECTYLELSIKAVSKEEAAVLRNISGDIYKPCGRCKGTLGTAGKVYVTDYGERYHGTLGCSGLSRNIYVVSITDIQGIGGCSKCVK